MNTKSQSIKYWPSEDRPREKLLLNGAEGLSNAELIAILLGSGIRGKSVMDLARNIQVEMKTFRKMSCAGKGSWQGFKGLGSAKRARLEAAFEIGRRLAAEIDDEEKIKIRSAEDAAKVLMPRLRDMKKEVFMAMFLDAQNQVLAMDEVTRGSVNMAMPILREVFEKAMARHAVAMICFHNHPSGNPTPSHEDRQFTRELTQAGRIMQIKVLDHIIIGDNTFFSFADQGLL